MLFEINFALEKYYGFTKDQIIDKLTVIISSPYLKVESKEIFQKAISVYKNANISFVDSFLLAKAKLEKLEIFTFDKKLSKA